MSTRQSTERRELEHERRATRHERAMIRRLERSTKHATADTRLTHAARIRVTA